MLGYSLSAAMSSAIYTDNLKHIIILPKTTRTKLQIQTAAKELTATNELLAVVKSDTEVATGELSVLK